MHGFFGIELVLWQLAMLLCAECTNTKLPNITIMCSLLYTKVDCLNVGWCILTVLYHQQKEKALRIWLLMSNSLHILKIIGGQEYFPMVLQKKLAEYQIKYWGHVHSALIGQIILNYFHKLLLMPILYSLVSSWLCYIKCFTKIQILNISALCWFSTLAK